MPDFPGISIPLTNPEVACDDLGRKGETMAKSAVYPRVYEYGPIAKFLWCTFYLAVIVGGLASSLCWFYDLNIVQQVIISGAGVSFAVGSAVGFLFSLRGKLVLHETYLEYHGVFALRHIRLNTIKETCEAQKEFGAFYITLVMTSGRPKRVKISDFGKWDEAFEDFINAYPNIEIEAQIADDDARRSGVDQNLAFGSNEDQRIDNYNFYVRWVNRLKWPAAAIAAWGAFYPEPYDAGIYANLALPIVCLFAVIISQGRLSLTDDNTSGRVSLSGLAFFSICALLLTAVAPCAHLIDWIVPAVAAVAAAFIFTALIAVVERRFNWEIAWATLIMSGLYAWSAGVVLNDILDHAKPRIERVQVLGKETRGSDPDYELHLAAWGTFDAKEYEVSRKLYDKAEVGQAVCIRIYPGWLGWENYYVRSCDSGKPA
jgi:hypothetical protein